MHSLSSFNFMLESKVVFDLVSSGQNELGRFQLHIALHFFCYNTCKSTYFQNKLGLPHLNMGSTPSLESD